MKKIIGVTAWPARSEESLTRGEDNQVETVASLMRLLRLVVDLEDFVYGKWT